MTCTITIRIVGPSGANGGGANKESPPIERRRESEKVNGESRGAKD